MTEEIRGRNPGRKNEEEMHADGTGMPVLSVRHLVKKYDDEMSKDQGEILRGVDLTIHSGEFVCILGPSGCGKSTFLRCVGGYEDYEGEILVGGRPVTKPGPDRTMVFQDFAQLFPWKTVEKNIQYPLKISGIRDKAELQKISDLFLEKVELSSYARYYPHQLSGGMKQRAAIARALAMHPQLILMDEPLASLDAMTRNNLQEEIRRIHQKEHMTVIFITHNIQEAICLGTRLVVMNREGRICYDAENPLPKPVTPSSPNYGKLWDEVHSVLYEGGRMGPEAG